jgi:hypothetical protein
MSAWKLVLLALLGVLAVALVYGIPVGSDLTTTTSASKLSTMLFCYSLHWNGMRRKVIDLGASSYVNHSACWKRSAL